MLCTHYQIDSTCSSKIKQGSVNPSQSRLIHMTVHAPILPSSDPFVDAIQLNNKYYYIKYDIPLHPSSVYSILTEGSLVFELEQELT